MVDEHWMVNFFNFYNYYFYILLINNIRSGGKYGVGKVYFNKFYQQN